jgi:hypothetical protein
MPLKNLNKLLIIQQIQLKVVNIIKKFVKYHLLYLSDEILLQFHKLKIHYMQLQKL